MEPLDTPSWCHAIATAPSNSPANFDTWGFES